MGKYKVQNVSSKVSFFFILIMHTRTACALLEVTANVSKDEIEKAYKRLALKFHPDKNRDIKQEATSAFQLIQNAKDVLLAATRPFYEIEESPFEDELQEYWKKKREEPKEPKGFSHPWMKFTKPSSIENILLSLL